MTKRCAATGFLLSIMLIAVLPSSGHAGTSDLDNAWKSLNQPNYRGALGYATKALQAGDSGAEKLAEIYSVLGITLAGLGRTVEAKLAFEKMLAIRPDARIRMGYAPKITRVFRSAQEDAGRRAPLSIRFEQGDCSRGLSIVLVIDADPLAMVVAGRAVYATGGSAEREVTVSGSQRIVIAVPEQSAEIRLAALDEYGNRLAELGTAQVPIEVECGSQDGGEHAGASPTPAPGCSHDVACSPGSRCVDSRCIVGASSPPLYARWSLWAGAAAAIGGLGIYYGIRARSDQRELDDLVSEGADYGSVILPMEERWRGHALRANSAFVIGGVAGVVSAALLWRKLRSERRGRKRATTSEAVLVRGGAILRAAVRF